MKCHRCSSERILEFTAKCSDCSGSSIGDFQKEGYVPRDLGIGGGDYVEFNLCLDCGQMQGEFPREKSEMETVDEEEDILEEDE